MNAFELTRALIDIESVTPNEERVGDYLFDSTINGVLDSADHVAGWLATRFESSAPARHQRGTSLE